MREIEAQSWTEDAAMPDADPDRAATTTIAEMTRRSRLGFIAEKR
ncbi:hypothetical protein [Methylocystis sp. WRRC1]|nr:hypothetical protein [Methylocystis sp. WRRC1]